MSLFIKPGVSQNVKNHLEKFLNELNELRGVDSCYYRGNTDSLFIETNEMWDVDVFNDFFNNFEDVDVNQDAYNEYIKHEKNGVEEFRRIRAESVAKISTGERTIQQAIQIENKLKDVKALIVTGDWGTGLEALKNVEVDDWAFTQEFKDKMISRAENYIQNEYILLRP